MEYGGLCGSCRNTVQELPEPVQMLFCCCLDVLNGFRQIPHIFILQLGSLSYAVGPDCGCVVGLYRYSVGVSWYLCRGSTVHTLALALPSAMQKQTTRKSRLRKPGPLLCLSFPKALESYVKIFVKNCLAFVSASRETSAERMYCLKVYGAFVVVVITASWWLWLRDVQFLQCRGHTHTVEKSGSYVTFKGFM